MAMLKNDQLEVLKGLFECKSKKEAEEVHGKVLEFIEKMAVEGGKLGEHLTFKKKHVEAKPERMGVNPKDPQGDKIRISAKPACDKVVVKVGKALDELV